MERMERMDGMSGRSARRAAPGGGVAAAGAGAGWPEGGTGGRVRPRCAIIDSMSETTKSGSGCQLIVRNLEEAVVRELKRRAARHGRSAEAEHREILRQALLGSAGRPLKDLLLAMPPVGEDADFVRAPDLGRDVDL